jgi:chromosomal replication initiation ATPase DnaA
MSPARQLVLDLSRRPALGRDDFLVTPANRAAVAMIDRWPDWPAPAVLLIGPPGCGKTHLIEVWRTRSGASVAAAGDLREAAVPELVAAGALALEDAPGRWLDEKALFHVLNLARDRGATVLITAMAEPRTWGIGLKDLASRLQALPVARLEAPDDSLLRGVLVKLFADRQLAVEEAVISYLVVRMPRSLAAARALVADIDRRALEEKAEVTRTFVARLLAAKDAPRLFEEE